MQPGQPIRRLAIGGLIVAAASLVALAAGQLRSDAANRSAGTVAPLGVDSAGSLSQAESLELLVDLLDELKTYRVGEEHELAADLAQRIAATVRAQGAKQAETHADLLCRTAEKEFIGHRCASGGEARYYADLTRLTVIAGGLSPPATARAIRFIDTLFARGLPEEHGTGGALIHAECNALGFLLRAAGTSDQFTKEHANRLLASEWTKSCDVMTRFVFMALARFPEVDPGALWGFFEQSTDPMVLRVAARALARAGHLGPLVEMGMKRHPNEGPPIVYGIASADASLEWLEVLETLRRMIDARKDAPASWLMASQMVYTEWGREYLRAGNRPLHDLTQVMAERIKGRWEETSRTERTALMNAVTAGSFLPGGGFHNPLMSGDEERDTRNEATERLLVALAQQNYAERTGMVGGMMSALGCVVREPALYFDAADTVTKLPGARGAMDDVVLGIRCMARRGILAQGPSRELCFATLRDLMQKFETPTTPMHILTVAVEMKATELVPDLKFMLDRVQQKKLGSHPIAPYSRMYELLEQLEAQAE